jgi:hypothetical protein
MEPARAPVPYLFPESLLFKALSLVGRTVPEGIVLVEVEEKDAEG